MGQQRRDTHTYFCLYIDIKVRTCVYIGKKKQTTLPLEFCIIHIHSNIYVDIHINIILLAGLFTSRVLCVCYSMQPRSVLAGPIMPPPRTVLSLRSILLQSPSYLYISSSSSSTNVAVVALATFSLIPTQCICIFCVYLREPPIENAHTLFCRMRFFLFLLGSREFTTMMMMDDGSVVLKPILYIYIRPA